MNEYDVVIIGAGQAGLSMGYYLKRNNIKFIMLESQERVGNSWRNRYDSLVLFTPRKYCGLPELNFPGNPDGYPTKDETTTYLEQYAKVMNLPIQFHTEVRKLEKDVDANRFLIDSNQGKYVSKAVVIAIGPFHSPFIPEFSKDLSKDVYQIHSSKYRNPTQLKPGNVLIVGGGNSGAQIAVEVANFTETYLSVTEPLQFIPLRFLGKSIFWYFEKLGFMDAELSTKRGSWIKKKREKIYGFDLKRCLHQGNIILKSKAIGTRKKSEVCFQDGSCLQVTNIIWSTGFQSDFSWIEIEGLMDQQGRLAHKNGVSSIEGLYFIGLPWLSRRGSALLGWVHKDAEFISNKLVHQLLCNK